VSHFLIDQNLVEVLQKDKLANVQQVNAVVHAMNIDYPLMYKGYLFLDKYCHDFPIDRVQYLFHDKLYIEHAAH
jgi:hypothetical protein